MNKITKLLFAFVTIASFSLTSCEPDYVTDGSTVPSEAEFTITYYDNQGNVTNTEHYAYDNSNAQVSGTRTTMQDGSSGESYMMSSYAAAPFPNSIYTERLALTIFLDYNEPGIYELSFSGRNAARFFKENQAGSQFMTIDDAGYIEVENYTILEASVPDMYFRSRANFSFFTTNIATNQKAKVEGTITTNFKI